MWGRICPEDGSKRSTRNLEIAYKHASKTYFKKYKGVLTKDFRVDLGGFLLQVSGIFRRNFLPKTVQKAAGSAAMNFHQISSKSDHGRLKKQKTRARGDLS